jgi:hypothetical protein
MGDLAFLAISLSPTEELATKAVSYARPTVICTSRVYRQLSEQLKRSLPEVKSPPRKKWQNNNPAFAGEKEPGTLAGRFHSIRIITQLLS